MGGEPVDGTIDAREFIVALSVQTEKPLEALLGFAGKLHAQPPQPTANESD